MQFNSPYYIFFLFSLLFIYCKVKSSSRIFVLLIASYFFYILISWQFSIALFSLTLFSYFISLLIDNDKLKNKGFYLSFGVFLTLIILFSFKYLSFAFLLFFRDTNFISINPLIEMAGISFISFNIISYLIDIYYGSCNVERSFLRFCLYISFFPKILQGPIERGKSFLEQLKNLNIPTKYDVKYGFFIILWGLFLKTVVADRLAIYVNPIYENPFEANNSATLLCILLYTLQIYFDFAGYTKIAIGSSRMFGIHLMENFNNPLAAISCTDFWRRWHISLSTFLKDYLFLPLSMQLRSFGKLGLIISTLLTFILAGLWHGASLGFIAFGLYHGIWLSLELILKPTRKKNNKEQTKLISFLYNTLLKTITFFSVSFSFIFFRSENLNVAFTIIDKTFLALYELINNTNIFLEGILNALLDSPSNSVWYTVPYNTLILIFSFLIIYLARKFSIGLILSKSSKSMQLFATQVLLLSILFLGIVSTPSFVYFAF